VTKKFDRLREQFVGLWFKGVKWRAICRSLDISMGTVSNWRRKLGLSYRDTTKIRNMKRVRR